MKRASRTTGIGMLIGVLLLSVCACGNASATKSGDAVIPRTSGSAQETRAAQAIELRLPEAPGTVVFEDGGVTLDASNTAQGYIMAKASAREPRLKLRISLGEQTYTYDLPSGGAYTAFPLQMGDGDYTVRVLENAYDAMYEPIFQETVGVTLENEFAPYLVPSQFVDYDADSDCVALSYELGTDGMADAKKAQSFYRYIVRHVSYDTEKAATVQSGYLPDPDETLSSGKGICFDYSALLAAMLRAQNVPAQMVLGQVAPEGIYHAWNRVHLDGEWVWMDATLDGTGHRETDYAGEKTY